MQELLIDFINTFDLSLKQIPAALGDKHGLAKLTISQLQYVDTIYSPGKPTITEIAARLQITKASVTAGIQKLARLGYVVKTQSSQDKRAFHVSLTGAGEELVKAKYQALKEYGDFLSAALSEDEARQFEATLAKIVKIFHQTHQR